MKKHLLLLFLLCFSLISNAQDGNLDTSFNTGDIGFGNGDGADNTIYTTAIQQDGKIIIGGDFTTYNGTIKNDIARLNSDGSLDTSFTGTGTNALIYAISLQPDGKIIIGGQFSTYNGTVRNGIARLNTNGSLDTSFNIGTGANSYISTIAIQSDGKIIIGGDFTTFNGFARNRIARLNANGSLDTSFNPGTGPQGNIYTTSIQPDGKIIIGGQFSTYNGTSRKKIARLNIDGTLDTSFNPGSGALGDIRATSIQSDGKIIIVGEFISYNGTARNHIARVNTDGSLDTSFNIGTGTDDHVYSIAVQADGKIIIGGTFSSFNGTPQGSSIACLNLNGTLDASFNPGTGAHGPILSMSIQSDGKIIIGGSFTRYNNTTKNCIARLNTNGNEDSSFNSGTGANYEVLKTAVQSDGKIIIGGRFTAYNNTTINYISRLNSDGTLDTSFNPGGIGFDPGGTGLDNHINTISFQSDSKIIIGGNFYYYNGTISRFVSRLNTDGTLDTSFNTDMRINGEIKTTSIQSNGKIIIGGTLLFTDALNFITRLNTDGTLDTSFNPNGTGANDMIWATAIQPDGKIIIGGSFTTYNDISRRHIARLNADGTLDTSFNIGTGANTIIKTISIQPDGKIVIGGYFTVFNGVSKNYIARLNSDGTLDNSFNSGTGANLFIHTTAIQPDGKIIIGGEFTAYNETPINRIARLNSDGTLDTSFNIGTGANKAIYTTAFQPDGKMIIGGSFTGYNGIGRNRIARLNSNATLDIKSDTFETNEVIVCDDNASLFLKSLNTPMKSVSIYDITGKKIYENTNVNSNELKIDSLAATQQILIIKITDVTGKTLSKKIFF